jgi:hypothetical protein
VAEIFVPVSQFSLLTGLSNVAAVGGSGVGVGPGGGVPPPPPLSPPQEDKSPTKTTAIKDKYFLIA